MAETPQLCSSRVPQILIQARVTSNAPAFTGCVASSQQAGKKGTNVAVRQHPQATRTILVCLALVAATSMSQLPAEETDSFETPNKSWVMHGTDCPRLRVAVHERIWGVARTGKRAEHIQIHGDSGSYAYLTYDIRESRLIDEFEPRIWVKSNRPGIQFHIRVVLPRSINPKTGRPLTTLLPGESVEHAGVWSLLSIRHVRKLLDQAIPRLRREFGSFVDGREAIVDKLVINVYGGPGTTKVWLDDLAYPWFPPPAFVDYAVRPAQTQSGAPPAPRSGQAVGQVRGDLLIVKERPWLAKVIEHNGEPFAWLKEQGFNAIMLPAPATASQLALANELELWLIAPPPSGDITRLHDRILAWKLGEGLGSREVDSVRRMSKELRRRDPQQHRPLLAGPKSNAWDYRRSADIFLLERPVLSSQRQLAEQGAWWREEPERSRLAGPIWASIPTQLAPSLAEQAVAHQAGQSLQYAYVEPDQIRALAFHAAASGVRGFVFRSRGPLDREDAATRMRAKSLELLLHELNLIEPWVAGGVSEGDISLQNDRVRASVLRTERAQLLVITRTAEDQQFVIGSAERQQLGFTTSSISTSAEAHRITFTTMQPMRSHRVPGGFRIQLDDGELTSLILLTQNPRVMEHVGRTLLEQGPMIAHLRYEITEMHWDRTRQILERLAALGVALPRSEARIQEARALLDQSRERLQGNDLDWSLALANRAMAAVAALRRGHWEQAASAFSSPNSAPLCADFALLPEHWGLSQRMRKSHWGPSILPAGSFENLEHMLQSGWQRSVAEHDDATCLVELSLSSPRSGRRALRMVATPNEIRQRHQRDEPWLSVAAAPVAMRQGQVARIHGWVRTAKPFARGVKGLIISDSFTGRAFGEQIADSPGWSEFTLYRAAPKDDYLVVRFELSEFGDVMIDDLSISLLQTPESRRINTPGSGRGPDVQAPRSLPPGFSPPELGPPRSAVRPSRRP